MLRGSGRVGEDGDRGEGWEERGGEKREEGIRGGRRGEERRQV